MIELPQHKYYFWHMNVQGKILEIQDTQQVKDTFRKREFILEYAENPQYPEFLKFELIQDRCDMMDQFQAGDSVDVHFNLRGRKWTDPQGQIKYFNSLQAWRVQKTEEGTADMPPPPPDTGQEAPTQEPEWLSSDKEEDDLPF